MKGLDSFSSVIQSISTILWFRNVVNLRKLQTIWKDQEETGKSWEMTQIFKGQEYFPEQCFLDFHVPMNCWGSCYNAGCVIQGGWGRAHESVFLQSSQIMLMVLLCRQHFNYFPSVPFETCLHLVVKDTLCLFSFPITISKLSPNYWKLAKLGTRVMQQHFAS